MTERKVAGRYRLLEHLGEGGMGIVWRAHDELLDRVVAVKEVRYRGIDEEARTDLNRRTIREARTAGRLDHPSVIIVHDVIEEEGRPWIVMQLIRSRSLGEIIRTGGPLPPERVASVGLHVLGALRAAHAAGVLHRDVKPENVLLADDGRVVLTDFGIASMAQETGITRTGGMVGTPAYLPPERLHGLPATPESDLWSLGATLYAAAEGRPPFERATAAATMMAVLHGEPSPMTHAGPLATAVFGLMARDPAARLLADRAEALLKDASSAPFPPGSGPAGDRAPHPGQAHGVPRPQVDPPPSWQPDQARGGWQPGYGDRPADPAPSGYPPAYPPQPSRPAVHPSAEQFHRPAAHTRPEQPGYDFEPPRPDSLPLREHPTGAGSGRAGSRRLALLAGVPALVVTLGVGGWLVVREQDDPAGAEGGRPGVTAPLTPTAAPETTPAPTPSATPRPTRTIPAGWRLHRDPMGFSVAVPRGWAVKRFSDRDRVEFRPPGRNGFLWIESTEDPETDPVKHWEKVERGGLAKEAWPGYRRIGIIPLRYRGLPAADWEFTYLKDKVRVRVLDRGFRTPTGRPYAIYWEGPDDGRSNRVFFDMFTESFRP